MQTNITVEGKISKENKCIQTIYIWSAIGHVYIRLKDPKVVASQMRSDEMNMHINFQK